MLARAIEAGQPAPEFWAGTPRETYAAIRAYRRRRGWMAWHLSTLPRMKQMPSLERLCGDEPAEGRAMDPEALAGAVRAMRERLKQRKA